MQFQHLLCDSLSSSDNTALFYTPSHTAEANEGVGAGKGFAAVRPGSCRAGPRVVPGPNPQCHREAETRRTELPLRGKFMCNSRPGKN